MVGLSAMRDRPFAIYLSNDYAFSSSERYQVEYST